MIIVCFSFLKKELKFLEFSIFKIEFKLKARFKGIKPAMHSITILISLFSFFNGWSGSNIIELLFKADLHSKLVHLVPAGCLPKICFPLCSLDVVFQIY